MSYVECKYTVHQLWDRFFAQVTAKEIGEVAMVMTSDQSIWIRQLSDPEDAPWTSPVQMIGDVPHTWQNDDGEDIRSVGADEFLISILPRVIRRHNFEIKGTFRRIRGLFVGKTELTPDQAWDEVRRECKPAGAVRLEKSIAVLIGISVNDEARWIISHVFEDGMAWKNMTQLIGYSALFVMKSNFVATDYHNLQEIPVHQALIK